MVITVPYPRSGQGIPHPADGGGGVPHPKSGQGVPRPGQVPGQVGRIRGTP